MENQVGYGLRPTDEELVGFYLLKKIKGETSLVEGAINEVKICSDDPWNLRFQSKYKSRDPMWYFFSRIDIKSGNGNRQNRTTKSGKWKLTGDPVDVKDQCGFWSGTPGKEMKIGHKRVLVFLDGKKSEKKTKSDWVIHEFHCELLPEDQRKYVICRLEYKGNDWSILDANATDPTPNYAANMTNSAGSLVNQSRQGYSTSYNTEYDSPNQGQQFDENFIMQQPVQPSLGSFNHSSEHASANHGHQFDGNSNMHYSSQGAYSNSLCPFPEINLPNYGQWSNDFLHNPQQSVSYSEPLLEDIQRFWDPVIPENIGSWVDARTSMQEHYSDHRPKKPVTGFIDDSSDSETGSAIFEDTSSSTNSVGSSNELDHTPIDYTASLHTIERLYNYETQDQPKQPKSHLQGKEKVMINTQKSDCEWKMAEDSIKKTPSTKKVIQSRIFLDNMSQRKSQWNYLKNMIIGVLLFISIIGSIILVG